MLRRCFTLILAAALLISMLVLPVSAAAYHPDATLTGIDVSEHQGKINWEKVKADGIDFAIIRCGYGTNSTSQDDDWFLYNATECERLGIPYGVYLYSYATNVARAQSEAEHVLRLLDGRTLSYPVYFDMEDASTIGCDLAGIAKKFCGIIEAAGYPVGVYANLNWWNNYLTDPCFSRWHRWVAQYNSSCQYTGTYAMWQYTSSGSVNGISGRVDMNYLIGSPADHGTVAKDQLRTNKTTYESGEAIMVTAASGKAGSWVAIYGADDTISSATPSYYWYYVNGNGEDVGSPDKSWVSGKTYNIYDGLCSYRKLDGTTIDGALPPGRYTVAILYGDYEVLISRDITVLTPTSAPSLDAQSVYLAGESLEVTAVSYKSDAWVGLYPGHKDANSTFGSDYIYWYSTECKNGLSVALEQQTANSSSEYLSLPDGEYTVALFGDNGYSKVDAVKHITIDSALLRTNKDTYAYGEDILVTAGYNGTDAWVGLYKDDEKYDPENSRKASIFWYNVSDETGTVNILSKNPQREDEYTAGTYKLVLFQDSGYTPVRTVTITVTKAETGREVVREPGCTTKGIEKITYSDGTSLIEPIDALDHNWNDATCGLPKTCGRCGDTQGEALGHDWSDATCGLPKTCGRCGDTEGEALGHDWSDATCGLPKTCGRCGDTEGEALGHEWNDATCGAPKTCGRCGDTEGEALGHSWNDATCIAPKSCGRCGTTEGEALGHSMDKGVVTKEPTATECGEKTFTCGRCGTTETEDIPMLNDGGEEQTGGEPAPEADVVRIYGATRYETAFETANALKEELGIDQFSAIVVASGTDFADALSGSYLANRKEAPILLVRNNSGAMENVREYIRENLIPGGTVYLLGGENAVSAAMSKGLESYNVVRLSGATRYETNLEILKEAGVGGEDILVCTGKNFADGLSASAVNQPILLVKDRLTDSQKEFLAQLSGNSIYILGGTNAVSVQIEEYLAGVGTLYRISGTDRYETSVRIAETFFPWSESVVLASAQNFPDGLSGGSLAYSMNAPVILVADGKASLAADYAAGAGAWRGAVLGGPGLISDTTVRKILGLSSETAIPAR